MNARTTRRSAALGLAVAAALGGMADAHAVAVSHNGLGQVLLYPYYTVNGGNQTLISVVNTTNKVKAIRVRFAEARNGRDALTFNLYLSPFDTWTGAVFAQGDNPGDPARLITTDRSCTVPKADTSVFPTGVPFRNYQFSGSNVDHPNSLISTLSTLSRTREGYVEMIEMGELQTGSGPMQLAEEATPVGTTGIPANCDAFLAASLPPTNPPGFANNWSVNGAQNIDLPRGGVHGAFAIVDVADGIMVSGPATALTQFYTNDMAPGALHFTPDRAQPNLQDANNGSGTARADVVLADGTRVSETFNLPGGGIDAVSLALMQTRVMNEFVIETGLNAATEWVLTYPTKSFYVNPALGQPARAPFNNLFQDDGRAREGLLTRVRDRTGRANTHFQGDCCGDICGTPPPCRPQPNADNSANVLLFSLTEATGRTPVLGAELNAVADQVLTGEWFFPNAPQSGWATLTYGNPIGGAPTNILVGPNSGNRYAGLPVIGFAVQRFINANVQVGLLANYSGAVPHRGELELAPNQ
jgi:hypothetical protein